MESNYRDLIDIWFVRQPEVSDDIVKSVVDCFFMTTPVKEKKRVWNLYTKSCDKLWKRNDRLATEKEVELGVSDLVGEEVWGDFNRMMFIWAVMVTGRGASKVGMNNIIDGAVYICDNIDFFMENYKNLKKYKPKYLEFAVDEKENDTNMREVTEYIAFHYDKNVHGANAEYRRAVAIAFSIRGGKTDINKMTTAEKVLCRRVYEEMLANAGNDESKIRSKLKEDCEKVDMAYGKELFTGAFVFKITKTMKENNYSKCSPKQRQIIDDALTKIGEVRMREAVKKEESKDKKSEELVNKIEDVVISTSIFGDIGCSTGADSLF